jgi:hypothetical protein
VSTILGYPRASIHSARRGARVVSAAGFLSGHATSMKIQSERETVSLGSPAEDYPAATLSDILAHLLATRRRGPGARSRPHTRTCSTTPTARQDTWPSSTSGTTSPPTTATPSEPSRPAGPGLARRPRRTDRIQTIRPPPSRRRRLDPALLVPHRYGARGALHLRRPPPPRHVAIDWRAAGLDRPTWVRTEDLRSVSDRRLVRRGPLSHLTAPDLAEVTRFIHLMIGD